MVLLILIVHVVVSALLILIVLLQAGKGAGLAGLFGRGGTEESVISSAGGDIFLKKITIVRAIIFMITSLSLTVISSRQPIKTMMRGVPVQQVPGGKKEAPQAEKAPMKPVPPVTSTLMSHPPVVRSRAPVGRVATP